MPTYQLAYKDQVKDVTFDKFPTEVELRKAAVEMTGIKFDRIRLYYFMKNHRICLQMFQKITFIPSREFVIEDSGPQFSFMVNDLLEYIPPIIIWISLLFWYKTPLTEYIQMSTVMWVMHFAKRSFEAVFVHTYSRKTLPIFSAVDNSCFKNCLYYWLFSLAISYSVIRNPYYLDTDFSFLQPIGLFLWIISELLNGYSHLRLRALRPKGSLDHFLPTGFLFDHITSPNYTFEILAWLAFAFYAQRIMCYNFALFGCVQMLIWADQKRRRLAIRYPEVLRRGRISPFTWF